MRRYSAENELEELSAQIKDVDAIFARFDDLTWETARTKFVKDDAFFNYAKYSLTELKEERKLLREEKISIWKTIPGGQDDSIGNI